MSNTNSSSSDPRVPNNDMAQVNFASLAIRPKQAKADFDRTASSDPRIHNNDAARLNSAGLAFRPKQTQADSDKAGPGQGLGETLGATTLESKAQDEETLRGQSSTNISAGQPSTGQNAQVAEESLARRNQMMDQVLARVPTLGRTNLLYIVKLFGERPLADVKDELFYRGIPLDDSILLSIGSLALEFYADIVEEMREAPAGPSWNLVLR
ncbi:hypothetical protein FVEN_g2209 [Fusarium venenatum]|nr:hypothetical protein FVEN_g2209 [Fusarium venenatum]